MLKKVVVGSFIVIFLGIIALASGIKNSFKILPIKTSQTLEASPYALWKEFTAQTGRFKVLLPMPPQYAKDAVLIPETDKYRSYEMYISEKLDGPIFMVSLITYPGDTYTKNTEVILRDVIDELNRSKTTNRLKDLKNSKFQQYDALDFKMDNDKYNIIGKAFVIGRTVYLLAYIAQPSLFTIADYDYFIDSFKLLPAANQEEGTTREEPQKKE